MKSKRVLFACCCLGVLLAGCTASRPPGYNLPSADNIVPGETYTVGRNENVYAIAQRNGVKLREIIALNDLQPPHYALKPGQKITLPSKDKYAAPIPKAAPIEYIDKGHLAPASNGKGGAAGIVSVQEESLPPLSSAPVSNGPLTRAPAPEPKTNWTATPKPSATDTGPSPAELQQLETDKPLAPAQDKPVNTTEASQPTIASVATKPQEDKGADGAPTAKQNNDSTPAFGWPVRGTVISGFGPKGKGLDNDGINISAPKGSPVKAAEAGIVAYAGNEMKGFGNLVLIRHGQGWVTAYAHLERLVVSKDSIVAKGDMIGTIGTTGGVSSPQLHFETRQEGKPVDPELMIK